MPLRDATGPLGLGPGTGRGKGICNTRFGYRNMFRVRQGWYFVIVVPFVAVILRDLLNPSGMIRRIVHVLSAPKIKNNAYRTMRDGQFSEINAHSVPMSSQRKIN